MMNAKSNDEATDYQVTVTVNSNQYKLQYLGCWGGPWALTPSDIQANSHDTFTLEDNDRGGIWYRAINPADQSEAGFVTMSFTCPKHSHNSAEGSPSGSTNGISFISAGLQTYQRTGEPLTITYNVGTENKACWSSGTSNDGTQECGQTTFDNTRLRIQVTNSNDYQLRFAGYWNDNSSGASNWYWEPGAKDVPPAGCTRTFLLIDNDRAGLFLRVMKKNSNQDLDELGFANMSFTNPKLTSLSAEGSPTDSASGLVQAGLQHYEVDYVSKFVSYEIGKANAACWNNGGENDGTTVCDQTTFRDKRALIVVNNNIPEELVFDGYWNDNSSGQSNWYVDPQDDATIPPDCKRFFVLKDNDRAGLYFKQNWMQFHLSFTCPKLSSNSAEGSPHSGLQKYSESGKPVTFTYNVGTPNLACWNNSSSNDGRVVCPQTLVLPFHLRRWMGKLNDEYPNQFKNLSLRKLYMPGAHDAACYSITPVISIWAQTQDLNFQEQLMKGVRYMDLRPCYVPANPTPSEPPFFEENFFHHGPILTGSRLSDLTSQIARFYTDDWSRRSHEVVLLDFSHFENYTTQENWEFFFNQIKNSTLNPYLIPQGTFGPTTTLNQLWKASTSQRVILSVSPDAYAAYKNMTGTKPNIWDGTTLFAPGWNGTTFWPNKDSETELVQFINNHIQAFSQNQKLWALQAILTATATHSVHSLVGQARDALYGPSGLPWRDRTNIVITDYYDERTTIESILENIKRLSSPSM